MYLSDEFLFCFVVGCLPLPYREACAVSNAPAFCVVLVLCGIVGTIILEGGSTLRVRVALLTVPRVAYRPSAT